MNSIRRIVEIVFATGMLAALVGMPASAEVGAYVNDNGSPLIYELESIVDDPEPVGITWIRYYPDSPQRLVLNDQGFANGDGPPSLIMRSTLPVAAWAQNSPGGYDVVVSRFTGGSWTVPQTVADSSADELDPILVLDKSDGSIHLLYWVLDGTPRVMHRQAPADLSSWSAPVQVSQPGEIACRPSGAIHEGILQVVYEVHSFSYGSAPRQVVLAAQDGQTFSSEVLVTTQYDGDNWPQVHSTRDKLWVDWIDTECDMGWMRRQPGGGWEPVQTEFFETPEERDYRVRQQVRILALQ
jgi:hypothetical protein